MEDFALHPTIKYYGATRDGMIASYDFGEGIYLELNQTLKKDGYLCFTCNDKTYSSHRFIYECFNGLIPDGLVIDHINTIRDDNRIENLRAVTTSENNRNPLTLKHLKEGKRKIMGKPVLKLDKKTGEILGYYDAVKQAEEENHICRNYIRWVCDGKPGYYSAGGYKWEWAKYQYSCKWGKWWISGDL